MKRIILAAALGIGLAPGIADAGPFRAGGRGCSGSSCTVTAPTPVTHQAAAGAQQASAARRGFLDRVREWLGSRRCH
jgi:hypothetical protein